MKRERNSENGNDGRTKMALALLPRAVRYDLIIANDAAPLEKHSRESSKHRPWDQPVNDALLALACAVEGIVRAKGEIAVRGLIDELNRCTAGSLTKRGQPGTASAFLKEVCGGARVSLRLRLL